MTEVQMKNLSRMHIHPNRMGAIRDSEVKQFFLNAKPQKLEFGLEVVKDHFLKFGFNLLYTLHRRFEIFLFITNNTKNYNLFNLCHPQGYPAGAYECPP